MNVVYAPQRGDAAAAAGGGGRGAVAARCGHGAGRGGPARQLSGARNVRVPNTCRATHLTRNTDAAIFITWPGV